MQLHTSAWSSVCAVWSMLPLNVTLPTPIGLRCFFFCTNSATPEIYTLSLHDALPISDPESGKNVRKLRDAARNSYLADLRSEEHTSELQSHHDLVCRLLLEKKNLKVNANSY